MRPGDLARLKEPYPENVGPTDADARAAIGINLPRWTVLEDEIFADFADQPPYVRYRREDLLAWLNHLGDSGNGARLRED
jgi:hypothetical protein